MKPFRFSLQPIRVLREQKEQTAQKLFGDAMRACDEAAYQLQLASNELASGWNSLCEDLSTGVHASKLTRTRAWCSVLELRQKERIAALKAAKEAMDAAWKHMMLATRDREAIDNYHQKCRGLYDRATQREEQKVLDEVGVRRATIPSALQSPQRQRIQPL